MKALEILIGTLTFVSFLLATMLTPLIKRYVDEDKVRKHENIRGLFSTELLPRNVLTATGQRLWLLRNTSFVVAMVCVVLIVVWQQILK